MNNHKLLLTLLMAAAFPLYTSAQTRTDKKISSVHCKGLKRFSEAQLRSLIKIPPGSPFEPALLEAATQALGATGAFNEVRYSYRPVTGGVAVEFQVKESVSFRRCTFDNFPFATDAEIRSFITSQVPLYDGFAPDAGNMLDQISTSLESLAKSKGISASVSHLPYTKLGNGDCHWPSGESSRWFAIPRTRNGQESNIDFCERDSTRCSKLFSRSRT
jgi:outer membrane protein assembly factor BamA